MEFSDLLRIAGIDPKSVKLLRHHNEIGRTPFTAWMNDRPAFEKWQADQKQSQRGSFAAPYWASFVSTPGGGTMFVGLYAAKLMGDSDPFLEDFLRGGGRRNEPKPDPSDHYSLDLVSELIDFAGRLFIDWPAGRNWKRRADGQGYTVLEIRKAGVDPPYPGHSEFFKPLSEIETLPSAWQAVLQATKGIYVLTCPREKAHYVGKADGSGGFFGRWMTHASAGGDAVGFRLREPSEYMVGILEVAGSFATSSEIDAMESRWKEKLQSRSIGINRN